MPLGAVEGLQESLAVVAAIEISCRHPIDDGWAVEAWKELGPALVDAIRTRPAPAGSVVAAWPLEPPGRLGSVAALALEVAERFAAHRARSVELRGGIALGVIGGPGRSDAVERSAERLALAAAPGQWLVAAEAARHLQSRFELRGAGVVARWPLAAAPADRALVAPLVAPVLPSAVSGDPPVLVLGRDPERRRLLAEFRAAAAGARRVVLVTAPAGGGKSHLLRRVLADTDLELAAGIAFPPLGGAPMDPVRALLAELGAEGDDGWEAAQRLGARIAAAASAAARTQPAAVVVDDIHWADAQSLVALRTAIAASDADVPLVWILSARTAAVPRLGKLVQLADAQVALPPLDAADRAALLERRLGTLSETLLMHVAVGDERGNPLYLEHLAAARLETDGAAGEPGTLHEAVLSRLDALVERARQLTRWPRLSPSPRGELEALERELGDWLDRLETSDMVELATIGRYLGRLRQVDFELVIARSLLGMPVASTRRLAQAIERLAAASTDALLDYLATVAGEGRLGQAVQEAEAAAQRAELALRLADAERLLAFACERDSARSELTRRRGDLALSLGRPQQARGAYGALLRGGDRSASLQARIARADAAGGRTKAAIRRLKRASGRADLDPVAAHTIALDLARLRGAAPPASRGRLPAPVRRRTARVAALAHPREAEPARQAGQLLVLDGPPALCAAELIETAAQTRLAGVQINGLSRAAERIAAALDSQNAHNLLHTADIDVVRRTFLHWAS